MPGTNSLMNPLARRCAAAVTLVAALLAVPAGAADRPGLEESRAFVEKLADDAVRTWSMDHPDEAARLKAMDSLIRAAFDVAFISRAVLGRYWRKLDPAERSLFRKLFPEFRGPDLPSASREVHAATTCGYSVRVRAESATLSSNRSSATTRGTWIDADWRVRAGKHGVRIIDVTVAGVSLLLVQRQEFESVIRNSGFASLVDQLRERLSKAPPARG